MNECSVEVKETEKHIVIILTVLANGGYIKLTRAKLITLPTNKPTKQFRIKSKFRQFGGKEAKSSSHIKTVSNPQIRKIGPKFSFPCVAGSSCLWTDLI